MLSFLTFNDAINHLCDAGFGISQDKEHAILKRACRAAYRDLMDRHRWRYGHIEYGITLAAPYETGTLAYDHTGGVYERQVTLSSGTLPDEAESYKLLVSNEVYPVDEVHSSTAFTLDSSMNPGADIAAGTSYTLYRDTYPLPDDFLKIDEVLNNGNQWLNWYVEPGQYLTFERQRRGLSSNPFRWTVMQDAERPGGFCLRVAGYPREAANLVFIYQRAFQEPVLSGLESYSYSTSNSILVALQEGSPQITGTGTAFNQRMVNSIIRVGVDGTNLPTDDAGVYPFAQSLRIKSVESTTGMTAYTDATETVSERKFVISDLLDMHRTMFNAFLRGCEWQHAVIAGKEQKIAGPAERLYDQAVRLAMQQDNKVTVPSVAGTAGAFLGPLESLVAYGTVEHN